MKNCGCCNVGKHRDIKDGEKYITLDIYLNFGSLDKMKITSSDPKGYLGRLGKGLITSLGLRIIRMSKKNKKERYAITNASLKNIYNNIKEFKDFYYEGYAWKRFKYLPTHIYFYLSRHIAKCMVRFNMRVGPIRTKTTDTQKLNRSEMITQNIPNFYVCYLDKRK